MAAPVLIKAIPAQVINERASYGPYDLKQFIQVAEGNESACFSAQLKGGGALPTGLICTEDGLLTGIPAKDTTGLYEVVVSAENSEGVLEAVFPLTIKPSIIGRDSNLIDKLKQQVWAALEQRLPIPDISELLERPITPMDVNYILERWGVLKIWDAYNFESPGKMEPLILEGASEHYDVYDRGSCIVMCAKDLYSHERTLEDGLRTARAMMREAYMRDWTVELVGFYKFTRAAWIEGQHLSDVHGKRLEVINYEPSVNDVKIYMDEALKRLSR